MSTIVTITGHKNTKKDIIAQELAKADGAEYIRPYCDRQIRNDYVTFKEEYGDYEYINIDEMDDLIQLKKVLALTPVNGHRYVFFDEQMKADCNIVIADDYAVIDIKNNYDGEVKTVRLVSDNEEQSDRVGEYLFKHEFDYVFNVDSGSVEELQRRIGSDG